MKLLIGTKNPAKIQGAKQAFQNYFEEIEIEGIPVSSNVSDEPVDNEIYEGAKNRVDNLVEYAKENKIDADYYLAIESGITNLLGKWINIDFAVIIDRTGYESWGTSAGYPIPNKYVEHIKATEMGTVMDEIFGETDLRSAKSGINILTHGVASRISDTENAFVMALTQYLNDDWNDR